MSTHDEDDDGVGYGKPPKHSRFKKGQSGNPKGRPKGAKGLRAALLRELESPITIREGKREIRVSKAEAMAKRFVEKGLKGEFAAMKYVTDFEAKVAAALDEHLAARDPEPEIVDGDILAHLLRQLGIASIPPVSRAGENSGGDQGEGAL